MFLSVNSFAKFIVMGVDVDCSISDAISRFEKKGFQKIPNEDLVKGHYLNHPVTLKFVEDKETKIVGWVVAFVSYTDNTPKYPNWSIMKNDILDISSKLKEIYQVDYITRFDFETPFNEGDGNEFQAIYSNKANIYAALYPDSKKNGVFLIKIYPTSFSADEILLITHFYNIRSGFKNLDS